MGRGWELRPLTLVVLGNQHCIDFVDDSVSGQDIGAEDVGVVHVDVAVGRCLQRQALSAQCWRGGIRGHFADRLNIEPDGQDVVHKQVLKAVGIVLDLSADVSGQASKGGVCGSKDRIAAGAVENVGKSGFVDQVDKGAHPL